jgi:hypothetical protein
MAELVEWQDVENGDVVKLNSPNARWRTVHNVDQQRERQYTHFDFVDGNGRWSHASEPKSEVIRRKRSANIYDQHREAVRQILADVDGTAHDDAGVLAHQSIAGFDQPVV